MPGPKMGPRPEDFDECLVRKAPTYQKWARLLPGEQLSYACRQFVKGAANDEERLMRRIMIARRNNLKDHATLKEARAAEAQKRGVTPVLLGAGGKRNSSGEGKFDSRILVDVDDDANKAEESAEEEGNQLLDGLGECPPSPSNPSGTKRRRIAGTLQPSDEDILMEMDIPAVEATRSYRKWCALPAGATFTYNQTYTRGKDDHDWLFRKNIWRRMRYRRENRVKVAEMKSEPVGAEWTAWKASEMSGDDDAAVRAAARADANDYAVANNNEEEDALVSKAVVDAAAAAAAQVEAFEPGIDADAVAALGANDPIVSSALDAAAMLAAAAVADAPGGGVIGPEGGDDGDVSGVVKV
mmetsp:Transcript_10547/g.18959  ORF Transcript_10547/g.18959 Transcript_10547/m.18959 type:complete len:355 (+) Transcript_10547:155-1219(+)